MGSHGLGVQVGGPGALGPLPPSVTNQDKIRTPMT